MEGIKLRLLWCDWEPPEALRGPQPLPPRDLEALEHRQREERQKLCVCVYVCGSRENREGNSYARNPQAPEEGGWQESGQREGMGRGRKIWSLGLAQQR